MDDYGDPEENPIRGEDAFLPNWYVANDDEHGPPMDNVVHEGVHNLVVGDVIPTDTNHPRDHTEEEGGRPSGSRAGGRQRAGGYVDVDGVYHSDESEPRAKCTNLDGQRRTICSQLGRMGRPNRLASRKCKMRKVNAGHDLQNRLKRAEEENLALKARNMLLRQQLGLAHPPIAQKPSNLQVATDQSIEPFVELDSGPSRLLSRQKARSRSHVQMPTATGHVPPRSFSAARSTSPLRQPSQIANTADMPSGSAQAPLRPSRAYVDAEGVFYSDEQEPNPKCKNNKDEQGRGLCAQLGRMCGICLKRRPNRQAARKHKQRLLNTQRAHEERLQQLDGENRALRAENELLGQRVSSSVASSQNAHANSQGGASYKLTQQMNVGASLLNGGNVSVHQHPANPHPPVQHPWSGSAAVAVVQPYQNDRSDYDRHGNLSQYVGQDSRIPAATDSWVPASAGFAGGTSPHLAGAGYVALAPPVAPYAHPCGSPDDVYAQQHAPMYMSGAMPSQQSGWPEPSSVQAPPQEAIESEDWSGIGLRASNPTAGVDQAAADETQPVNSSVSPTYETTELDEELINLILQRDSYDMDPLLGNADESTEPHRPPDAAQVASEGQCEEQAESSADEGSTRVQPQVVQDQPTQQLSVIVPKASIVEPVPAGPESPDPPGESEENDQNPQKLMELEPRNDAEEAESSRAKKKTLTGYWTKAMVSPSETRSHNAERLGGPTPLESFKAQRIASAREELSMVRTALETLKQSPEPNTEAIVRMDAFVEKLASEIRDFTVETAQEHQLTVERVETANEVEKLRNRVEMLQRTVDVLLRTTATAGMTAENERLKLENERIRKDRDGRNETEDDRVQNELIAGLEARLNTLFAENGDMPAEGADESTSKASANAYASRHQAALIKSLRVQIATANEQREETAELIRNEINDVYKEATSVDVIEDDVSDDDSSSGCRTVHSDDDDDDDEDDELECEEIKRALMARGTDDSVALREREAEAAKAVRGQARRADHSTSPSRKKSRKECRVPAVSELAAPWVHPEDLEMERIRLERSASGYTYSAPDASTHTTVQPTQLQLHIVAQMQSGGLLPLSYGLPNSTSPFGDSPNGRCPHCGCENETLEHLILLCRATQRDRERKLGTQLTMQILEINRGGVVNFLRSIGRL